MTLDDWISAITADFDAATSSYNAGDKATIRAAYREGWNATRDGRALRTRTDLQTERARSLEALGNYAGAIALKDVIAQVPDLAKRLGGPICPLDITVARVQSIGTRPQRAR